MKPSHASRRAPITQRSFLAVATVAGAAALAPSVAAQDAAIEDEFSVQRFNPAPGPRNYFTTRGARVDGDMAWSAGLFANYAYKPFVVVSCISETNCDDPSASRPQDVAVVENLVAADLMGSLTVKPRIQIGLRLPVAFADGQGISENGGSSREGLSGVGLGDAELEGKFRLYGEVKDPFVLGAAAFVTGPFGTLTSEGNYIGDSTPSAGVRGIFDGEQGPFSFGGNLAGVFRGSGRVGSTEIGPEFRYNVAAGFRVSPVFRLVAEGFGGTKFSSKNGTNSLEVDGGFQVTPLGSPITITAGAGTGLIEGVGVPAFRGFLGVVYVRESGDVDNDGIDDAQDQCPTEPEDKDGYEDGDGCPDVDNDQDTIPDASDKCPSESEDSDGFEDTDGCPEPDNDKDGIPDHNDRCPNEAETKNGFRDDDGCPDEADEDKDGVPDSKDKCPKEPEDTDGFQDTDGCPDPDNDGDGVPDDRDECIDQPETVNEFQDEDGCPDEAPAKKK